MTGPLPRKLQLTVPAIEGETTLSYMSRLAAANFRSLRDFARDIAIPISDVRAGAVLAVRKLARLGGVDPQRLQFNTHQTLSRHSTRVRGQLLSGDMRRRLRILVCPLCLRDDVERGGGAYNRISWTIGTVRTCVAHSVALVELVPDVSRDHLVDFTRVVRPHVLDLATLVDQASSRPPTSLERYVEDRLAGTATTPWLDSLELHVAVRTAEAVGLFAEQCSKSSIRAVNEDMRLRAGATGFEILREGVPALHEFLENACRNYKGVYKASTEPGTLLSPLYADMANGRQGSDYLPVKRAIADFVTANFPVGPGDTVLGFPVEQRRFHSATTAIRQHGLTFQPRIRRLLMAEAKPTASCLPQGHFLFDAAAADAVCSRETRRMPANLAKTYLGVTVSQLVTLRQAGLIERYLDGSADSRPFYDTDEMDALWARIARRSVSVTSAPKNAHNISHVVRATHTTIATVVNVILEGKLTWIGRLGNKRGLDALLIDLDEMKALTAPEPLRGLTTREAARKLAIHEKAITALIDAGFLVAEKQRHSVTTVSTVVISPGSIESFADRYVSAFHLAMRNRLHIPALIKKMASRGIAPAPELSSVPVTLYRIADL